MLLLVALICLILECSVFVSAPAGISRQAALDLDFTCSASGPCDFAGKETSGGDEQEKGFCLVTALPRTSEQDPLSFMHFGFWTDEKGCNAEVKVSLRDGYLAECIETTRPKCMVQGCCAHTAEHETTTGKPRVEKFSWTVPEAVCDHYLAFAFAGTEGARRPVLLGLPEAMGLDIAASKPWSSGKQKPVQYFSALFGGDSNDLKECVLLMPKNCPAEGKLEGAVSYNRSGVDYGDQFSYGVVQTKRTTSWIAGDCRGGYEKNVALPKVTVEQKDMQAAI